MALMLPLQVVDSFCRRCCSSNACTSNYDEKKLAELLVNKASLFDVIKWQRVSKKFRKAAQKRLNSYTRIDVQVYSRLKKLREEMHNQSKDLCFIILLHSFVRFILKVSSNIFMQHISTLLVFLAFADRLDWHPTLTLVAVELGPNHLGIAVDSLLKWKDVRALFHLLITLSRNVEHLCIDSPIIEMLVAEVNKRQVKLLVSLLCQSRTTVKEQSCFNEFTIAPIDNVHLPEGPFFPNLKQLTISSQTNQLEHLSRLLSYSVSVNLIYHVEEMDLLCLKISIGSGWSQSKHFRLFRHLTRFRQWTEASLLGERYFQQFGNSFTKRRGKASPLNAYT
ncbi:unnamed protein product [Enterobius vermicularis]|uniref:F-box domain-containing protein n=1 Tax=Enterobius vermicularis TaxID=51028 RepID=A0A0N4VD11_ENTVE|nr:unnamed protein product [Enterobius vermicularis]